MNRKMSSCLALVILCVIGLPHRFFAALPEKNIVRLNLQECLDRAVGFSPEMDIEGSQLGITKAQYQEALSLKYLPKFELVNVSSVAPAVNVDNDNLLSLATRNDWTRLGFFNSLELNFVQPLFTFGRVGSTIEAARFGVEAQEKSIIQRQNEIKFRITRLYFSRLLTKELIVVAEEAMKIVEKAENTVQEMLDDPDSKNVNESDLFRIRVFMYELERIHREVVKGRETALSSLKILLGYTDDVDFDIADEYLDPQNYQILPLNDYHEMKNQFRPEIARLNAAVSAQKALEKVSRSLYYPQFFIAGKTLLSVAPIRDDIRNPFLRDPWNYARFGVAFGISMPLNFSQTRAKVMKERYEYEKIKAQRAAALLAFDLEVENAYKDLIYAKKDMEETKESLRISREWLTTEEITFDLDASNTKDLADAVKENLTVKAGYLQSIFEYNVSIAKLKLTTGILGRE